MDNAYYYWVDPDDATHIEGPIPPNGQRYDAPNGDVLYPREPVEPNPDANLYPNRDVSVDPPEDVRKYYYNRGASTTFVPGDQVVEEATIWEQFTFAELQAAKTNETIGRQRATWSQGMLYQANGDLVVVRTDDSALAEYNGYVNSNVAGGKDLFIAAFDFAEVFTMKKNEADNLVTEVVINMRSDVNATAVQHKAVIANWDTGDWNGLAAYDAMAGYPLPPPGT